MKSVQFDASNDSQMGFGLEGKIFEISEAAQICVLGVFRYNLINWQTK